MAKTDPTLGNQVKQYLTTLGLETLVSTPWPNKARESLERGVMGFLDNMGLNFLDPSILDTPRRVADMFVHELCKGLNYENFPKCTTTPNGQEVTDEKLAADLYSKALNSSAFKNCHDGSRECWEAEQKAKTRKEATKTVGVVNEMVLVDSIQTVSLCEHHFQTIHGVTHIAYIPGPELLGLSKFARVTDFYARRPQVQERMTEQVYAALSFILKTPDIAVQQVCVHNCMRARGAMDPSSKTTTSKMGGKFMEVPALRNEFLQGIKP